MSMIRQKAEQVAALAKPGEQIDIIVIAAIFSIITSIVQILKLCNLLPVLSLERLQKPGILGTLQLRRLIRGQDALKDVRYEAEIALRSVGKLVTADELNTMFAEVK